MKKLWLTGAVCTVVMLSCSAAFALSSEQAPVNTDGSTKFNDPDDQMPSGLTNSDQSTPQSGFNISGSSSMGSPYAPQPANMSQGQSSFDNAYNHVTNSR